jgi:hypothetical protein
LQLINKLLLKELEETTAKLEVMSSAMVNMNSNKFQNSWQTIGSKMYRNIGRHCETKGGYMPDSPIVSNNKYGILSNLMDYPSSKDVSGMDGTKQTKKMKTPYDSVTNQTKFSVKH